MKIKFIQCLIVLTFIPIHSFGQTGYYKTKDLGLFGIKLINDRRIKNAKVCQIQKDGKILELSPYEVTEYGFGKKKIYVSKNIQLADSAQRVFLERLVKGKINLYFYKGKNITTYFIEKDSSLFLELPHKSENIEKAVFKNILSDITLDCKAVQENIKFVRYKRNALAKFTQQYNTCAYKPFPFLKYGIIVGFNAVQPVIPGSSIYPEELKWLNFKYDGSFIAGVFLDKPIFVSDISFHSEIYISTFKSSYNFQDSNNDVDLLINSSSLNIPILLRYTYPGLKINPFLNLGVTYTENIKNKCNLYKSVKNDDIIIVEKSIKSSYLSSDEIGLSMGGGFKRRLNHRNYIFIEFRYNRKFNYSSGTLYNKNEIQLFTGINF